MVATNRCCVFALLFALLLVHSLTEAGKGKEILGKIKEKIIEAKDKMKAGWERLTSQSEYACPAIDKFCEDHCAAKKAVGKCDDFKCNCIKL
uniref:Tityustoxin-19 n=1 Tax=Tityus serrulatus TaxID=6887 RepID=KBX2_TITSE|nr:RecName: Full=Tityustoxin-19; Short=Ts19; AltName: Full=Potassium channel toxin beta-Ktx 2; Contains: RecName: Full=Ts19 fragment I; AltName: Full=Potassium channel toxin beta-Ktx 2-1; Contains: RecName: Full=Ts19 fragment II; Short=Ts19 Frag-II; AltName: Full=Potassium channel toxin beta-Ktx 2-2; Contains: RecName: Full=Ts19 fragment III; Short=Ts19 Frag-III; Flags: Precursor [Tityus serrulatus]QPD99052.1 potassium channel toxin Ts19 [Tityus serrulatus]